MEAGQLTQAPTSSTWTTPVSVSTPRRKMSPPSAWMAGRIASIVVRTFSSSTGWHSSLRGASMVAQPSRRTTIPPVQPRGGDLCSLATHPYDAASMSARAARCLWAGLAVPAALLADLVLGAAPASAHNVSAGSLPAPSWLLGYIGAFAVAATAIALRSTWPKPRLQMGVEVEGDERTRARGPRFTPHDVVVARWATASASCCSAPSCWPPTPVRTRGRPTSPRSPCS